MSKEEIVESIVVKALILGWHPLGVWFLELILPDGQPPCYGIVSCGRTELPAMLGSMPIKNMPWTADADPRTLRTGVIGLGSKITHERLWDGNGCRQRLHALGEDATLEVELAEFLLATPKEPVDEPVQNDSGHPVSTGSTKGSSGGDRGTDTPSATKSGKG